MAKAKSLRREFVESMERRGAIKSPAVRRAFLEVPREAFLGKTSPERGLESIYDQWSALVTKTSAQGMPLSSSTQPNLMARMIEALDLEPGHRVLEVGAGTGYNAALLSKIVGPEGKIVSVDIDPEVAEEARKHLTSGKYKVKVEVGDGRQGWLPEAPFDRIIVTAHANSVPRSLVEQLAPGGLLQIPLRVGSSMHSQLIPIFEKEESGALSSVRVVDGGFMALRDTPEGETTMQPSYVSASEFIKGKGRAIASLWGPGISRLSQAQRTRLLQMVLEPKDGQGLGFWGGDGLVIFLTQKLGQDLIGGWLGRKREVIGVVDREATAAAVIPIKPNKSGVRLSEIVAFGNRKAEQHLRKIVKEWRSAGSPEPTDFKVRVNYEGRSRRGSSQRIRLGDCWVEIEPSSNTPPSGNGKRVKRAMSSK